MSFCTACPVTPLFSGLKANGMAVAGSEGAAIHPAAAAREGEPIVVKHRISPFVGTDLETLLRASGIDTLVLAGVSTSGVVLPTVRHAGDLDYRLVVVRDCCADPDAEVHAMLLDIVMAWAWWWFSSFLEWSPAGYPRPHPWRSSPP